MPNLHINKVDADKSGFFKKLKNHLKRDARLAARIAAAAREGEDYVHTDIRKIFSWHPVVKSLLTNEPMELRGDFGINRKTAGESVRDMNIAITNSMSSTYKPVKGDNTNTLYNITISLPDTEDFADELTEKYEYESKGGIIPWMR